jgi:hypothetical protein
LLAEIFLFRTMFRVELREKIEQELAQGEKARQEGFEGRARVCARRAAGIAIREYLRIKAIPSPGLSAVDLLEALLVVEGISGEMRQAAQRLLMRVDEDYSLPADIDLLADARWLAQELERDC